MSGLRRIRLGVTCTASAATALVYVESGLLYGVGYTKATASAYATGATATIDILGSSAGGLNTSDVGIATHGGFTFVNTSANAFLTPRMKPQTSALATAADLTNGLPIPIAREHVRIVIASGGASGNGWWDLYLDEAAGLITPSTF